jgi:hypothetical protein
VIGSSPAGLPLATSQPAPSVPPAVRQGEPLRLSGLGLELPKQLPFERWLGIGRQLSAVSTSAAWCLGDWLVFGEKAYAGRYRQAVEQTSLDYQTLRNYAWVAHRFALPRRRDRLSFGHHAEVAALADAEQDYWLRKAEEHRWPVKRLRREIRVSLAERSAGEFGQAAHEVADQDWVVLRLEIRISPGQLEACQAAAGKASLSIEAWSVLALEHAARNELPAAGKPTVIDNMPATDTGRQRNPPGMPKANGRRGQP